MPTYPNMPLIVPTPGGSSGAWSQLLNAALLAIDTHRHEGVGTGGAKIHPASMDVDDDLSFSSHSATNLRSAAFSSGQAVTGARKLYVGADGNLYWNNGTGTAIQVTDGNDLNVGGFIGGIGGDYTSVSADLDYDDSGKRYTFKRGDGTWARIAAGELRIQESGTSNSIYVALSAPAGLASQYTLTFPGSLPAAKRLVQTSSAGVITFENTGVEAVTMASNASITLSGTGEIKHGDRERTFSALAYVIPSGGAASIGVTPVQVSSSGSVTVYAPIPMLVGDRIKSITLARFGNASADITNIEVLKTTAAGVDSSLGSTSVTNPAASWADTALDLTDTTIATGESLTLVVAINATGIALGNFRVTFDHP